MELKDSQKKKADIPRRPDLDVIIVAVTWGILLYHVCRVYSPWGAYYLHYPELNNGTIREDAYTIISAEYIVTLFHWFVFAWAMPVFFYISGKGEYFIKCQIKSSLRNAIVQINIQLLQASTSTTPCSDEPKPSSEMSELTASLSHSCFSTWSPTFL